MSEVICKNFQCEEDLSQYVDSMLFDSDTNIATGTFEYGDKKIQICLDVRGEVDVDYKGENYRQPSDFPEDLRDKIKKDPLYVWYDDEIAVSNNNWFEYIMYVEDGDKKYSEGIMFEDSPSDYTPQKLKQNMIDTINIYFYKCELLAKVAL